MERERPQHLEALSRANEIRLEQVALKREIRAGTTALVEALDRPEAERMTVYALVASQHRWGRARSRRLLARAGITELTRVGRLTDRQGAALREALGW